MIESTIGRVAAGEDLSMREMADAIGSIMEGRCGEGEIGVLLTALATKGETVEEVAGAATAMREHMTPIQTAREGLIDTCGTGGDFSGTFNISTAAALITSAAGVPVAKHGNRAMTSKTGSADVLAALGVNVEADTPVVERCLDEVGICFCFAQRLHPAMKHVAPVRKQLGVRTIFNLLGPLCNPASAPFQLLGVGQPEITGLLAEALVMLGTKHSLVVNGADGLDEVTLNGATHIIESGDQSTRQFNWTPADFGLNESSLESIQVETAEQSAAVVRDVLHGNPGAARDIVIINSAAALWTAGKSESPTDCAAMAAEAIDSGAANNVLAKLAELSNA
ncbi:MAG: anthranilate phosphoribosyltransferase [Pirellulales bacterium]